MSQVQTSRAPDSKRPIDTTGNQPVPSSKAEKLSRFVESRTAGIAPGDFRS